MEVLPSELVIVIITAPVPEPKFVAAELVTPELLEPIILPLPVFVVIGPTTTGTAISTVDPDRVVVSMIVDVWTL
jgi:hypothetical protein